MYIYVYISTCLEIVGKIVWKDLKVTMNFLVLNIVLLVSVFFEVFKSYQIVPDRLYVEKEPLLAIRVRNF